MSKEIQELDTAEDFYAVLSMWHAQQVDTLKHMMDIPPGTDANIEDPDGNETLTVKLEGDALQGFKVGIAAALSLLGELPFAPIEEESDQSSDDQQG